MPSSAKPTQPAGNVDRCGRVLLREGGRRRLGQQQRGGDDEMANGHKLHLRLDQHTARATREWVGADLDLDLSLLDLVTSGAFWHQHLLSQSGSAGWRERIVSAIGRP